MAAQRIPDGWGRLFAQYSELRDSPIARAAVEIQNTRQLFNTLIYSDQGFLREKAWPRKAILGSSWCRPAIERS